MSEPCSLEAARRLEAAGLVSTRRRCLVLGRILASGHGMSPPELLADLVGKAAMNKVTLYRILDLLVEHHLVQRSSLGERAWHYCARDVDGRGHGHFQCRHCGAIHCLPPENLPLDLTRLRSLPLTVEEVEIRVLGLCEVCGMA